MTIKQLKENCKKEQPKRLTLREAAKIYHDLGYKIVITDDQKRPVTSWKDYMITQDWQDIDFMLKSSRAHSIALIATDGIEVVDIDCKYDLTGALLENYATELANYKDWKTLIPKILVQKTKNQGYHFIYKTNVIEGNQKLAQRYTTPEEQNGNPNDKVRVLLETRAKGGYFLVYPSEGYEFDNYDLLTEHKEGFIYEVTDKERTVLINTAKSFDECAIHHKNQVAAKPVPQDVKGQNKSTIQDYKDKNTPLDILLAQGWTAGDQRGEVQYMIRPGKTRREGHGATYNDHYENVYIFTSSTQLEQNTLYDSFALYAALNHNDDTKAAAAALYREGYGDRMSRVKDDFGTKTTAIVGGDKQDAEKVVSSEDMDAIFQESFISVETAIEVPEWKLSIVQEDEFSGLEQIGFACFGDVVTVKGLQKSRKSAIVSAIGASALSGGKPMVQFSCDIAGKKILYIDTEQAAYQSGLAIRRMYKQAGLPYKDSDKISYHRMKKYTKHQKQRFLSYAINRIKNVGLVILDGIVDLCEDYNDNKVSSALVTYIERLADEHNCLFINVLHNARSTGQARGHIGTELLNKSAAIIDVKKAAEEEGNFSTVSFPDVRGKAPQGFDITHNEAGELVIFE